MRNMLQSLRLLRLLFEIREHLRDNVTSHIAPLDDELPSIAMLRYISEAIETLHPDSIVGFVQHQCASRDGRFCSSLKHTGQLHRPWRLFQPARVEYIQTARTPGYTDVY